jgi:predicted Co/Zn/Cd cation transporter (cation efflux family)
MIIHGRLQWALAAGVLVFSFAAVIASLLDGGRSSTSATTTTTSVVATNPSDANAAILRFVSLFI